MSYESTSVLSDGTRISYVREAICQLGYKRCRPSPFFAAADDEAYAWFEEKDYRSFTGVYLHISADKAKGVSVYTRSNAGRSFHDRTHQNLTIKTLRRRFGGHFQTDFGRNRYFAADETPVETPEQAGCHLAFQRFGGNLLRADWYLTMRKFPADAYREVYRILPDRDPQLLSNHLLLPYLVSIWEEYVRSTFVALLRYSPKKESILKGSRPSGKQLSDISDGITSVEDAVADGLSFQSIQTASDNLKLLDGQLDLSGLLRRPYHRRKTSLFDSLSDMVRRRHAFVHRSQLELGLKEGVAWQFVDDLEAAVDRVHRHLTSRRGWFYDKGWGRPKGSARLKYTGQKYGADAT